ncbi:MAG TPA: GAF domain-containing protein, partial [Aggregatilineales bacterium]|nr:GAF domain-containing protein [Aggregatilineales bacterium]
LINRRGMIVMFGLVILTIVLNSLFSQVGLLPPFATAPLVNATITSILSVSVDALILVVFAGGQRSMLSRNLALSHELRNSTALAAALGDVKSIDELLEHAIEIVRDRLNYYHVQIFLHEPVSGLLVLRAGTTLALTQPDGRSRRIEPGHPGVISDAATQGKLQIVTAGDPQTRRSELLPGMQFEAVLPLHSEDAILGVLDVQSPDAQTFSGHAIEVLQAIATPLALALNSLRMSEEIKSLAADRRRFSEQLKAASIEIERLNREVSERAWSNYLEGRGTEAIGYDWSPKGIVSSTSPFAGLERTLNSVLPELRLDQNEHVLSVPVVSRGQVLGAMEFRAGQGRVWTERSLELARLIAQRLALALDNIRLYEQAQGLAQREQVASQISARLQARTDVDSLVVEAAEVFRQALGATRTQVRLGTPEDTERTAASSRTGLTGLLGGPEKSDKQNGGQPQ